MEVHTRKFCSVLFLSLSISRLLNLWNAGLKEKGHNMLLKASGRILVRWRRRV